MKAFWTLNHIVFAMAAPRIGGIHVNLRRLVKWRRTEKLLFCRLATCVPINYCKTNARVNVRCSKMLSTNRAMRSDCRRRKEAVSLLARDFTIHQLWNKFQSFQLVQCNQASWTLFHRIYILYQDLCGSWSSSPLIVSRTPSAIRPELAFSRAEHSLPYSDVTIYIFAILYYHLCFTCNDFYYLSAWGGCWFVVYIRRFIYKFLNVCPFDYTAVAVSGKVGP